VVSWADRSKAVATMPALPPSLHRTTGMPVQVNGKGWTLRSGLLLEGITMNYARSLCSGLCVVGLVWLSACTAGKPYVNLANYLHSEQGFAEWKKGEEQLEKGVVARPPTINATPPWPTCNNMKSRPRLPRSRVYPLSSLWLHKL